MTIRITRDDTESATHTHTHTWMHMCSHMHARMRTHTILANSEQINVNDIYLSSCLMVWALFFIARIPTMLSVVETSLRSLMVWTRPFCTARWLSIISPFPKTCIFLRCRKKSLIYRQIIFDIYTRYIGYIYMVKHSIHKLT